MCQNLKELCHGSEQRAGWPVPAVRDRVAPCKDVDFYTTLNTGFLALRPVSINTHIHIKVTFMFQDSGTLYLLGLISLLMLTSYIHCAIFTISKTNTCFYTYQSMMVIKTFFFTQTQIIVALNGDSLHTYTTAPTLRHHGF